MKNNKLITTFSLMALLAGVALACFLPLSPVKAQSAAETSVVIEPAKFDISTTPGSPVKKTFSVINRSNLSLRLKLEVKGYRLNSQTGKLEFFDTGDTGMSKWLVPEFVEITLKPLESKDVQFFVAPASDASSGGYYGAILLSNTDSASAGLKGSLGELVLLSITGGAGQATVGADISSFSADRFGSGEPVKFALDLNNNGNTHLTASGNIRVINWLGKEIKNFKTSELLVYPGTTKHFVWNWKDTPLIGFYRTEIDLVNTKNASQTTSAENWFIIFPWPFALYLVLPLLILAGLIIFRRQLKKLRFVGFINSKSARPLVPDK